MNDETKKLLERALRGEDVRDLTRGMDLAAVAAVMREAGAALDGITEQKTAAQRVYDTLRMAVIPEIMDAQQLKSANVDGIGRVTLTSGIFTAVNAGKQEELKQWLIDHGFEDLIKEQVNSSTLNAWTSRRVKAGEEIPDCVKITPFTRASITQV